MNTPRTEAAARHIDGFADKWVPQYVSEELERELKEANEYADRLVEHKDMVCLPADLANLREANAHFAIENEMLKNAMANDRDAAAAEAEEFAEFCAYKENQVAQYTGTNASLNIDLHLANQDIIELTEQRDALLKMNEVLCQFMNDEFGMTLGDPRLTKLQAQMEQAIPNPNKL